MVALNGAQKDALKLHAESAILAGHNDAWTRWQRGSFPQAEPLFVGHLCSSLSDLAVPWRTELRRIDPAARLSISAVFTHQKPYVDFTVGGVRETCELSDLMVTVIDRTDPNAIQARCIFVQAKRDDAVTVRLAGAGDLKQLYLYTQRPLFNVVKKNAPKSVPFPASPPDTALNYGITPPIDLRKSTVAAGWATNRWMVAHNLAAISGNVVTANVPLQQLLVDLLEGTVGWGFQLAAPGRPWSDLDNSPTKWSALVNYILQETAASISPSYLRVVRTSRGNGEQRLFLPTSTSHGLSFSTLNIDSNGLGDAHRASWGEFALELRNKYLAENDSRRDEPPRSPGNDSGESDDGQWGGISVVVVEVSVRG